MTYREKALRIAEGELGVTEFPPGTNRGPRVNQYLAAADLGPGYPWCMAFVNWAYKQAGLDLEYPNEASVGFFLDWAKRNGYVVHAPQRGDVVCYRFDADDWPDHTGIVVDASLTRIVAIEGNTAYGDDANGGKVMHRTRQTARCAFVRIPGESAEDIAANKRRLKALRDWILKRRAWGWTWAQIKKTPNWREFVRRGGK